MNVAELRGQLQLDLLPRKPYCKDEKGGPPLIRSRKAALRRRFIQVNDPWRYRFLLFDVDSDEARFAVEDAGLPQPCWTALSENGHAHIAYQLETPVYLQGRKKPLEYLAAVENGVRRALRGDSAYSGFLTHNPVHPDFETVATGYALELGDLAAEVDLSAPSEPVSGIGRNCETFEALRKHAARAIILYLGQGEADFDRWEASCIQWAVTFSQEHHDKPLWDAEANGIGRSVAKWIWKRFSLEAFSAIQAARGRKGGLKGGLKPKRGTLRASASKTETNEQVKPWLSQGISRRTWYRRRAGGT